MEPGLLRFGDKRFHCVDGERKEIKKYNYSYTEVYQIVIRARHQHVDMKYVFIINFFCFWL